MDRRTFIKTSGVVGTAAALDGCGHPEHQLIRFIPEEDLQAGVATWKRSVCTLCPAGCGTLVKVMEGEAEAVRNGRRGLIKMGLAKKVEGDPQHPVNRGKLCARGQAILQVTYHPDRLRGPLRRAGDRGSGRWHEISWEEAIGELVSQLRALQSGQQEGNITFLTKPPNGVYPPGVVEAFLRALGASGPVIFEPLDESVLRRANQQLFDRAQLPTFDLARTNYLISFGADFLGTWNSPVAQSAAYGEMRQGRPGQRAKFVMVEPRLSQTGANADEWIAAPPGSEGAIALAIAHVIVNEELFPSRKGLPEWQQVLTGHSPAEVESRTGVKAAVLTRIARELAAHRPALAMIGGSALAQTNGLFNALAVNLLNVLLDSVGQPGGLFFTGSLPPEGSTQPASVTFTQAFKSGVLERTRILLLKDANPVLATPQAWRVVDLVARVPFIASFGCFLDETSVLADLILPDHSPLESALSHTPESGTTEPGTALAAPVMRPLYNTRAMSSVLIEAGRALGGRVAASLSHIAVMNEERLAKQSGWIGRREVAQVAAPPFKGHFLPDLPTPSIPEFAGDEREFPFHLLPYPSLFLYDGSLAHLPWMQEAPDPLSTAMWGSWVEINPRTAVKLGIQQGDLVEVTSAQGSFRAPALLYPGIRPDTLGVPFGQGHENYTRYASHRGANPFSILAPLTEPETGSLAWAATRVKIARVGKGKLVLFGGQLYERPSELLKR